MPRLDQLFAQLREVIDLAVEDDAESTVVCPHRLSATCEIQYRQPPVTQIDGLTRIRPHPFVIRPAMREGARHPLEIRHGSRSDEADDSAHADLGPYEMFRVSPTTY